MKKPKWLRKIARRRFERRMMKTGRAYHHHYIQLIAPENELLIQLEDGYVNDNLTACLAYGRSHPMYRHWLLMASIKFRYMGSLCSPDFDFRVAKPPQKVYGLRLFDRYLDCLSDAETRLEHCRREYGEPSVNADALLKKYTLVKKAVIRMLADTREFYFAHEYRDIIDYIANTDEPVITFREKFSALPELPNGYDNDIYYGDFMN